MPQPKTKKRKAQIIKRPKDNRSVAPKVTEAEQQADTTPVQEATKVDVRAACAKPIEEPVKTVDGPPPPWAKAHPRAKVPFTVQLSEERHLQLTWLKKHMPNTSIQKIIQAAIDKKVERLLGEFYEP